MMDYDTKAARDVLAERLRQVTEEGWTAEHDDRHDSGEIAIAAACYAIHGVGGDVSMWPRAAKLGLWGALRWPWDWSWWKPKDRRRDLVRAGALIIAEIERLDRISTGQEG